MEFAYHTLSVLYACEQQLCVGMATEEKRKKKNKRRKIRLTESKNGKNNQIENIQMVDGNTVIHSWAK